jgi:hypothetical protein
VVLGVLRTALLFLLVLVVLMMTVVDRDDHRAVLLLISSLPITGAPISALSTRMQGVLAGWGRCWACCQSHSER